MTKDKKTPKEASNLFSKIIKASVRDQPKDKKKDSKEEK